jgi:hypothetical protein
MNKFRVSNDKEQFQEQPIDVTSTTVDQAVSNGNFRFRRNEFFTENHFK